MFGILNDFRCSVLLQLQLISKLYVVSSLLKLNQTINLMLFNYFLYRAAFIALIPKVLISSSCVFGGAAAYAYFGGCDLIKEGILEKSDQIMPYFVLMLFRGLPGLVGFYVAAVYSGTLR